MLNTTSRFRCAFQSHTGWTLEREGSKNFDFGFRWGREDDYFVQIASLYLTCFVSHIYATMITVVVIGLRSSFLFNQIGEVVTTIPSNICLESFILAIYLTRNSPPCSPTAIGFNVE